MEASIVKIKITDVENQQISIVELDTANSDMEILRAIIENSYSESVLIFIADKESKLDISTLYKICKTIYRIVGESLKWDITDTPPNPTDKEINAYLILKNKSE